MYQNQQQAPATHTRAPSQVHQSYTVQHDFSGSATLTTTLTHALSDVSGIDVSDVESTLEEYVDSDALDTLFSPIPRGSARANGQLSFDIQGYQTTVYGNGVISIVPPLRY